jgi:hypothetical protein
VFDPGGRRYDGRRGDWVGRRGGIDRSRGRGAIGRRRPDGRAITTDGQTGATRKGHGGRGEGDAKISAHTTSVYRGKP